MKEEHVIIKNDLVYRHKTTRNKLYYVIFGKFERASDHSGKYFIRFFKNETERQALESLSVKFSIKEFCGIEVNCITEKKFFGPDKIRTSLHILFTRRKNIEFLMDDSLNPLQAFKIIENWRKRLGKEMGYRCYWKVYIRQRSDLDWSEGYGHLHFTTTSLGVVSTDKYPVTLGYWYLKDALKFYFTSSNRFIIKFKDLDEPLVFETDDAEEIANTLIQNMPRLMHDPVYVPGGPEKPPMRTGRSSIHRRNKRQRPRSYSDSSDNESMDEGSYDSANFNVPPAQYSKISHREKDCVSLVLLDENERKSMNVFVPTGMTDTQSYQSFATLVPIKNIKTQSTSNFNNEPYSEAAQAHLYKDLTLKPPVKPRQDLNHVLPKLKIQNSPAVPPREYQQAGKSPLPTPRLTDTNNPPERPPKINERTHFKQIESVNDVLEECGLMRSPWSMLNTPTPGPRRLHPSPPAVRPPNRTPPPIPEEDHSSGSDVSPPPFMVKKPIPSPRLVRTAPGRPQQSLDQQCVSYVPANVFFPLLGEPRKLTKTLSRSLDSLNPSQEFDSSNLDAFPQAKNATSGGAIVSSISPIKRSSWNASAIKRKKASISSLSDDEDYDVSNILTHLNNNDRSFRLSTIYYVNFLSAHEYEIPPPLPPREPVPPENTRVPMSHDEYSSAMNICHTLSKVMKKDAPHPDTLGLSGPVRQKVCLYLYINNLGTKDWRDLADVIGLEYQAVELIEAFTVRHNHETAAEIVLRHWQFRYNRYGHHPYKCREKCVKEEFKRILLSMHRHDVVRLIDDN